MRVGRLIQRLKHPSHRSFFGLSKDGFGFNPESLEGILTCFSIDFMGASEFETGSVPRTLTKIAKDWDEYELIHVESYGHPDEIEWRPRETPREIKEIPPIFSLCKPDQTDILIETINQAWKDDYYFKSPTGLQTAIKYPEEHQIAAGWLDLEYGFFYFLDWEVCQKTQKFFDENRGRNFEREGK